MATMTLSLPDKLKVEMDKIDWINWSSVARHAFAQAIEDFRQMQMIKKVNEISEIGNAGEVNEAVAKELAESIDKTAKELKAGKRKPMTLDEFNKMCEAL